MEKNDYQNRCHKIISENLTTVGDFYSITSRVIERQFSKLCSSSITIDNYKNEREDNTHRVTLLLCLIF